MIIIEIFESPKVIEQIQKWNLTLQYQKAKTFILQGEFQLVDLKKRQPKDLNVWYFRINKQFRAMGYKDGDCFFIYKIDNHQ